MKQHVYFPHRLNVTDGQHPDTTGDTSTLEALVDEVIGFGADGVILCYNTHKETFFAPGSAREIALRERWDRILDRCDGAGIEVRLLNQELSKSNYGNPVWLPTVAPTGLVYELVKDRRARGEKYSWTLDASSSKTNRLFYPIEVEPFRYYELQLKATSKNASAKLSVIFRRWDEVTQEYSQASYIDLTVGNAKIPFHSLDAGRWEIVVVAKTDVIQVMPVRLVEKVPTAEENYGELDAEEAAFWMPETPAAVMYKCRPTGARMFHCNGPDVSDTAGVWKGFGIAVNQWFYLKGNHSCLRGWKGTNDEPTAWGWSKKLLDEFGSAGEAYAWLCNQYAWLGYTITGEPVLLYGDAFDPNHNGVRLTRTCAGQGGGFETAFAALDDNLPAIFICWGERIADSIQFWANSGKRWWLGIHLSQNNVAEIAALVAALPVDKQPEAVVWFTWDYRLIHGLGAKMDLFR